MKVQDAEELVWKACIRGDANAIQSACMQLASTGAYGPDKLEYASNLLSSVEVNAVLITGSKGDTYPVIILQYLKGMRTDVRVIHADWLKDDAFFDRMKSAIEMEKGGVKGIRLLADKHPVYVSLAADREMIADLASDLYCTGLAFKYSAEPLSNVKSMYTGWWTRCAKNYMASGYSLNANYLVPVAMLAGFARRMDYSDDYVALKKKYAEIAVSVGESDELPGSK
ncbi:MAG: hypothetical protein ACKOSR_07435 [Flavobacteriales bacterium]